MSSRTQDTAALARDMRHNFGAALFLSLAGRLANRLQFAS